MAGKSSKKASARSTRKAPGAPAKKAAKKTAKRTTAKKASKKAVGAKTRAKKTTSKAAGKKAAPTKTRAAAKKSAPVRKAAKKAAKKSTAKKTAAKKKSTKKVAAKKKAATKKAPAKSSAKKAPATAKKAAAKKPVAKAAHLQKASTQPVSKATAAKSKKATKKIPKTGLPPVTDLETLPTEDLWAYYRRAVDKPKDNGQYLEDLRNLLIERHYPLVRYIAERLLQTLPKSIELDDLISAGLFGLMDAIRGFDPSRGIKFKTYCSTRIRGSILDQLRSQDWVPRLVRLKAGKIERALQRLTGEFGREPTHAELAKVLEMEHDDLVKEIQEARAKTMFSLSEKWEDDDGSVEKVEILEDRTAIDPVGELNRRDLMLYMTRSLTHKERFIIEQYYQFGHTMREIGEMLALTESRVCQIHSNVMGRLKSLLQQREESLLT